MAQWLKQSTAHTFQLGPFVDSVDGFTPETALTIAATDVDVSKAGGAFGDKNDATALTGTGDAQGWYDCVLDATDTGTLGPLTVRCYVAGALPVWKDFVVLPANVYDSLIAGSDALQVHANEITAGLITADAIATDAIDADAIAAGAVTEIQAGLSTLDAAGVRTAVGLGSANLDTQLAALAAFIDTEVAAILAAVDTEVAAIKTVTDQLVAAQAEPVAAPAANATPLQKVAWLAALARNKITQTATTQTLRNDGDSGSIATATVSDDATTATRGKWS